MDAGDWAPHWIPELSSHFWTMVVLALIVGFVFNFTAWGRHLFAIGGNEQAARLTGVPVDRIKFQAYVFSAFTAAIASLLLLGYNGSAINALGQGYELRVIAATVIGGANLMGGAGTAFGAVIGSALPRGHPQRAADGRHRFQLARRLRRRLHHSRGSSRHADQRQVAARRLAGSLIPEEASLEDPHGGRPAGHQTGGGTSNEETSV